MKKLIVPFMVSVVFILTTFLAFGQIESYFADLLDKLVHNHVLFSLASFLVLASDILLPVPSSLVMASEVTSVAFVNRRRKFCIIVGFAGRGHYWLLYWQGRSQMEQ